MRNNLMQRQLPNPFTDSDGNEIRTAAEWEKRREEIKTMLCREEYGFFPPKPRSLSAEVLSREETFCAGKAVLTKVMLTAELDNGKSFSFPIFCTIPAEASNAPTVIHINGRDCVPDRYLPSEEICDNGFATISFCYADVTSDDGDFTTGLAGVLFPNGKREADSAGKIVLWAWAASRVLDYALTLDGIDHEHITVAGHSRLGKTALVAGAFDERFFCAHSNDSGCSGAALARGTKGETIRNITDVFPYWFCKNYLAYADHAERLPFDQHYLLALLAPRLCYVASAAKDSWADPVSEYLSCVAASPVYSLYHKTGFVHPERLPEVNEHFHAGNIGYHLRSAGHYFSRVDWQLLMQFIQQKLT